MNLNAKWLTRVVKLDVVPDVVHVHWPHRVLPGGEWERNVRSSGQATGIVHVRRKICHGGAHRIRYAVFPRHRVDNQSEFVRQRLPDWLRTSESPIPAINSED